MARSKGSKSKGAKAVKFKAHGGRKAKVQDKADDVEMRTASPEIAGLEINDDDFDLHLASVRRAVEAQKRAKNGYDACMKACKKVSPAFHETIKLAIKMDGKDPEDIKRDLEMQGYVLKRSGSNVQLTIHDTLLGDAEDQAYARGKKAGAAGLSNANPYPKNSDLAAKYDAGWGDGQADLVGAGSDDDDGAGLGHNSNGARVAEGEELENA